MSNKKILNRADLLVFKAFQKAVQEGKIHVCLLQGKINRPSSPVYNPWETLLPVLIPVIIGLVMIIGVGIMFGLLFMAATTFASLNLVRKKLDHRLLERSRGYLTANYEQCCELWEFGGVVLINAADKKDGCVAPEGDWKEFVIKNFSDMMVEKKPQDEKNNDQSAA